MSDLVKCPFCAERIRQEAIICRHCDKQVTIPDKDTFARLKELSPGRILVGPVTNEGEHDRGSATISLDTIGVSDASQDLETTELANFEPTLVEQDTHERKSDNPQQTEYSEVWAEGENEEEEKQHHVRPVYIFRDVAFNLATWISCMLVAYVWLTVNSVSEGRVTIVTLITNEWKANLIAGVGSTIAFAISGCWGRQRLIFRRKRLKIAALYLFFITLFGVALTPFISDNPFAMDQPVAFMIGGVLGSAISIAIRFAVGLGLSLAIAKPLYRSSSTA